MTDLILLSRGGRALSRFLHGCARHGRPRRDCPRHDCPRRAAFVALFFSLAVAAILLRAATGIAEAGKTEQLSIVTATGTHVFLVEVMRTQAELEKGLMFRKSLPQDHGMLFDFGHEQEVAMWMRNTFIPLDMIFMGKTGRVVGVVADAKPMSDQILTVSAPTFAVLELDAGTAARINLKTGDLVRDPIFSP